MLIEDSHMMKRAQEERQRAMAVQVKLAAVPSSDDITSHRNRVWGYQVAQSIVKWAREESETRREDWQILPQKKT
jgi:hypothetical protein